MVPENVHTHPKDGHWKFQGGGVSIAEFLEREYETKLEIPGDGRVQTKKPSSEEVWPFFGTTY